MKLLLWNIDNVQVWFELVKWFKAIFIGYYNKYGTIFH